MEEGKEPVASDEIGEELEEEEEVTSSPWCSPGCKYNAKRQSYQMFRFALVVFLPLVGLVVVWAMDRFECCGCCD